MWPGRVIQVMVQECLLGNVRIHACVQERHILVESFSRACLLKCILSDTGHREFSDSKSHKYFQVTFRL